MHELERVIGFDLRVDPATLAERWDAERRMTYLLRLDVASPLSADVLVWPSLISGQSDGGWPRPRLAARVEDLRAAAAPDDARERAGWRIALTVVEVQVPGAGTTPWDPVSESVLPAAPDSSWQLLGFDVADEALLSGLSNCGYRADEAPALRAEWTTRLNGFHLFDRNKDADAFRHVSNRRVPEHAPFTIYGLYRLP